ncbi:hypothetical protein [Actinoplanes sp. M2I2]|uniref:hypothetical protein n=1 Tax=Actinoplanes sp. M2I2 TaxID=1734444 RepID=UPI002021B7B5|nr:hypothetical protein [Actinoplanes sp. M2I2]
MAAAADHDWNFKDAFASAAGVIPTLLLALVLQKELLTVAVAFSAKFRQMAENPPKAMRITQAIAKFISPASARAMGYMDVFIHPSFLILLAVGAELTALFGIAEPPAWRAGGAGRVFAFFSLGLQAFVIWQLIFTIALGLLIVSLRAESADEEQDDSDRDPDQPKGAAECLTE